MTRVAFGTKGCAMDKVRSNSSSSERRARSLTGSVRRSAERYEWCARVISALFARYSWLGCATTAFNKE